jgi:spore coat polysaccharide biosynthesis protein SpsF
MADLRMRPGGSRMLKTLGIVQASFGAQRSRCHCRRLYGQTVLEWVIRRATESMQLDGVIVMASEAAESSFLRNLVPSDIPLFVSKESDALGSFVRALEEYPAESLVRVRGDNPFVDPTLIDRLVKAAQTHAGCDYASFCVRDGRPAIHSPVGICAEWFRAAALRKASRAKLTPDDREHVTQYICAHPEKFQLRLIPAPEEIDRDDVRLTIDLEEDWEHALAIFEAIAPESMDWRRIADLLDHQPALRSRMAALNRALCRG